MIETPTYTPLRDAMYAMSLAKPVPDAELLDEYVRLYPEHAEALTEFAVELAVDALLHDADQTDFPEHPEAVSPVVSRVMSQFPEPLVRGAARPRRGGPRRAHCGHVGRESVRGT